MRRAVLALVCGILLLGGAVMPAAAESGSIADPSGDLPPRIDITRLDVENGNRWFSMRVKVLDLAQRGRFRFTYEAGRREYGERPHRGAMIVVHRVAGETRARFLGCSAEDCSSEPGEGCPRMRATWSGENDVIRVAAPQKCLWWLQRHPDRTPPRAGTFHVYAELGDAGDSTELLVLDRG